MARAVHSDRERNEATIMAHSQKISARKTNTRARRSVKMPRSATSARATSLHKTTRNAAVAGAALLAAGIAAAGATVMRRRIGKLASTTRAEAISAAHVIEALGGRIGKLANKPRLDMELTRLLTQMGLRKPPSLLKRLLPPAGILAALVAAAGSAFFLFAPKLREAVDDEMSKDGIGPSFSKATANGSSAMHDSIGKAGADVGEVVSNASR
jgi:hypothetical protein